MLKREVTGFLIVGLCGAGIDFGVFNFLASNEFDPILASLISVSLAGVVVYFGNLYISFRHVHVTSMKKAAAKFLFLALATITVSNLLVTLGLTLVIDATTFQVNLLKATVVLALMSARFLAMKFFVYVK